MDLKEKNNNEIKRKINICIKIVLLLLIYLFFYFTISFCTENYTPHRSSLLDSERAQAQNQKFESYKGSNVTGVQVKQLLSLININNLTAASSQDYMTIGVRFGYKGTGTDTTLIYIPNVNNQYTTDLTSFLEKIKNESTYKVTVPGVKAYDAISKGNDGFNNATGTNAIGARVTDDKGAYYSNGYIRLILIEEN